MEHRVLGLVADMRIVIPEGDLLLPPIAELTSSHRIPSSPRR
jgi:hypothetical protein